MDCQRITMSFLKDGGNIALDTLLEEPTNEECPNENESLLDKMGKTKVELFPQAITNAREKGKKSYPSRESIFSPMNNESVKIQSMSEVRKRNPSIFQEEKPQKPIPKNIPQVETMVQPDSESVEEIPNTPLDMDDIQLNENGNAENIETEPKNEEYSEPSYENTTEPSYENISEPKNEDYSEKEEALETNNTVNNEEFTDISNAQEPSESKGGRKKTRKYKKNGNNKINKKSRKVRFTKSKRANKIRKTKTKK